MVYDSIENFIKYVPDFLPRAKELIVLLKAVQDHTFEEIKKIDFCPLCLRFGEYETMDENKIPFEAHRKFWDLQIVLENTEYIGYAPLEKLTETSPYDGEEDIAFYSGSGQNFILGNGMAILLAPWDAHRPGISSGCNPLHIKKIVVKLAW